MSEADSNVLYTMDARIPVHVELRNAGSKLIRVTVTGIQHTDLKESITFNPEDTPEDLKPRGLSDIVYNMARFRGQKGEQYIVKSYDFSPTYNGYTIMVEFATYVTADIRAAIAAIFATTNMVRTEQPRRREHVATPPIAPATASVRMRIKRLGARRPQ